MLTAPASCYSPQERAFALFVDFVLRGTAGNDLLLKSTLSKMAGGILISDFRFED